MSLRLATLTDAAELSRLHSASFEDGWSEADFRTWLSRTEGFAVVACRAVSSREWEAVAFGLGLAAGDDAELLTIATDQGRRRAGLGRRIFGALDREAASRGLKRWVLEVARNNLPAIGLYKSSGFVEISVRKAYYPQGGGRVDALVLSRTVGLAGGQVGA
ncbi:MAG: GNAT family N-acetyltransferase [Hyphomonadaceae bacterium]|nr:GNAT family N-acetyltransferase [Hyphomonadaceae bacterium]